MANFHLKPAGNRVALDILKAEDKTSGGIVLPKDAQEQQPIGKIVAVGPDVTDWSVGQIVFFPGHAGVIFKPTPDSEVRVLRSEDLIGEVIEE